MDPMRFREKVAIVTGSFSGISQVLVQSLAEEGSMVVALGSLEIGNCHEKTHLNDRVVQMKVNLAEDKDVKSAIEHIIQEWKRIDILIHNFRLPTSAPFLETTEMNWRQDLDFNLMIPLRLCRHVLPNMVKQQYGRVVNIGSIAGRQPRPLLVTYSAAMAGLISVTRSLAVAMAPYNIRVNGICTGLTEDPMHQEFIRSADSSFIETLKSNITLGRWGRAEEVAAVALFLASDDASYMIGQNISVDGGNNML